MRILILSGFLTALMSFQAAVQAQTPAAASAATADGIRHVSQAGNGSTNGIATASAEATGQTVEADPSYPGAELPNIRSFSVSQFHYRDLRQGSTVDYYHNPTISTWRWPFYGPLPVAGQTISCVFDGIVPTGLSSGGCLNIELASSAPGWSLGNPGIAGGGGGWLNRGGLSLSTVINSAGITGAFGCSQNKYGTGDNDCGYFTINSSHNGWTAPSDEGTKALAAKSLEDEATYTGTINSAIAPGATLIKTTAVTDGGSQGVGQYLIDTTKPPVTGTYTAIGPGVAGNSSVTVSITSGTITPSQAWGTLSANAVVPINATPPFTTSVTIAVKVSSGTFTESASIPYCFAGDFHEQAFATAVSNAGGVATITIPLRKPHAAGVSVFQGGMCGYGLEETAFTQSPHGQPIRYLMDVVGSESSTNLQVVQFLVGRAVAAPLHSFTYQTANLASGVTNGGSGTKVSFTTAGGGSLFAPYQYVGATFHFSGLSDAALNAACTNTVWTSPTAGSCTVAGLTGSHTSSAAGTASLALNEFKLWPIAEVTDVQNETLSPAQVDGTLATEPNIVAFSAGDTIEITHHISALMQAESLAKVNLNPYQFGSVVGGTWSGAGACCGGNIPGSGAMETMANANADSIYVEGGGILQPPNFHADLGNYYNWMITNHAPGKSAAVLNINPSAAQVRDLSYCSFVWEFGGYTSALQVCPGAGTATLMASGVQTYNAASHKFNGVVNAVNGYQVNGSPLATANLADWSDAGAANGSIPVWNASMGKWVASAPPGGAGAVSGLSAAAAGTSSGTLSGAVTIRASATPLACTTEMASIANSTTRMAVVVSAAGSHDAHVTAPDGWVSSNGTVSVQICTLTADASAPSITYNIRVIQ